MFEFEVFRKPVGFIEGNTCDIVWTFWGPRSHSALLVAIRYPQSDSVPGESRPPRYTPATV